MNEYNWEIMKCATLNVHQNFRDLFFALRFYSWLFVLNYMKYFGKDFHPFIPGLEMKFALETAKKVDARVVLGGLELDQNSLDAFKVQSSVNPISLLLSSRKALGNSFWRKLRLYLENKKISIIL